MIGPARSLRGTVRQAVVPFDLLSGVQPYAILSQDLVQVSQNHWRRGDLVVRLCHQLGRLRLLPGPVHDVRATGLYLVQSLLHHPADQLLQQPDGSVEIRVPGECTVLCGAAGAIRLRERVQPVHAELQRDAVIWP